MSIQQHQYVSKIAYTILLIIIALFLFNHTPNVGYDTPSYIHFSEKRPPIYPLFIWAFQWAGHYQFQYIMWVQSILTCCALAYARHWLKKNIHVPDILVFCVMLVVLITICFHYQMWYIQSEGLTFPFFIFTFFLLMNCFQRFELKKIIWLSTWVAVLILTRQQFYYFYGIFILLCAWYLYKKIDFNRIILCACIFLISILTTTLIDWSYHNLKNGHFEGEQLSAIVLSIQPIYLAQPDSVHYFSNNTERAVYFNIQHQLQKKKLNPESARLNILIPQYFEYAYEEYARNYIAIQTIIADEAYSNRSFSEGNQLLKNISKTLVQREFKKNLLFYAWKVTDSMGGIPGFLFFSLLLFGTLWNLLRQKNESIEMSHLFVALAITITFFNALLVAVAEPALPPYFCYTQFLLYCLAAIFSKKIFFAHDR